MKGVGRSTVIMMGPLVEVPVAYRCGQELHVVLARVMEDETMSQRVDLLVGTTIQRKMRTMMDVENQRVELRAIGEREVVRLESLEVIENRMLCRPIRVLDLCAGVSGAYCALSDLGFKIEQWHAVEVDTVAV